ncbi:mitogen-activated protein kinase kinase kinase kinase 4-like, partial [Polyodon spathula]
NIEPRLLWERVEKLVPRPGSGSSSGSSNSGSQPGSQSGSGERFRVRSSSKSEGSPSQRQENASKKPEEKKDVFRPSRPAGEVDLAALAKELRAVEDPRPPHKVTDYSSSSEESGTTDEEDDDLEQEGADESTSGPEDSRATLSKLSNGETESVKTMIVHDDVESDPAITPSKDGTLIVRESAGDKKRPSHPESNGFAGRIHLLPDLIQQSHSSSSTSSPSSSQPTPSMSPQTPQDKLTANEWDFCIAHSATRLLNVVSAARNFKDKNKILNIYFSAPHFQLVMFVCCKCQGYILPNCFIFVILK